MQNLSWTIEHHKFHVTIDGHTRAKMTFPKEDYTGWELSADRANASRRILVFHAVDEALIERVTGYADTKPLPGVAPDEQSNQRVTLSLTLSSKTRGANPPKPGTPATVSTPKPAKPVL
jgi:chemotaxis protein MotB